MANLKDLNSNIDNQMKHEPEIKKKLEAEARIPHHCISSNEIN